MLLIVWAKSATETGVVLSVPFLLHLVVLEEGTCLAIVLRATKILRARAVIGSCISDNRAGVALFTPTRREGESNVTNTDRLNAITGRQDIWHWCSEL